MLSIFEKITDYDILFFLPHDDENDKVKVESALYKTRGEPVDLHCDGVYNSFDILLFRMDEEKMIDLERFQGVLMEPREYVSRMIKSDFYGMVARKTTTSAQIVQDTFDTWSKF